MPTEAGIPVASTVAKQRGGSTPSALAFIQCRMFGLSAGPPDQVPRDDRRARRARPI